MARRPELMRFASTVPYRFARGLAGRGRV